jgi:hypothetical protein
LSQGDIGGVKQMYASSGSTTTASATPNPTTTVTANPSDATVVVDSTTGTGTRTFSWTPGSSHVLSADVPAGSSTTRYVFSRWSDGGAITHTIVVPSTNTTDTAYFSRQHKVTASYDAAKGSAGVSPASSDSFYNEGAILNLVATPNPGYCFSSWGGLISGTPSSTSLSVTKPYALTANFVGGGVSVSPGSVTVPARGDSGTLDVTGSTSCTWTVRTDASWISARLRKVQGSSGTVSYSVSANKGAARTGAITIGGVTVTVSQAGGQ